MYDHGLQIIKTSLMKRLILFFFTKFIILTALIA